MKSGVRTRRVRDAPTCEAAAVCEAEALLGLCCWRDNGYATPSAFWANSESVG